MFQKFTTVALAAMLAPFSLQPVAVAQTPSTNQNPSATLAPVEQTPVLRGKDAFGDWTTDAPGTRRTITFNDLPAPYDTPSANNGPRRVPRPDGALPVAPRGFTVSTFATGLRSPRVAVTSPGGDVFVAESSSNRVRVLRDADGDGTAEVNEVFAENLKQPFGIAFYPPGPQPQWVYFANTDSVVRVPYQNGDLIARGAVQVIVGDISEGGRLPGGGHWTRDIAFSNDGKKMWVSVGSRSNVDDNAQSEHRRACILEFTPEGKDEKMYASGIRNPVGLAVDPITGALWTSVNERDGLGDDLVPDYVTKVREGGFYGWPWYYLGGTHDPRHAGKRPELQAQVITPDVLIQAHSASLALAFYTGKRFPAQYRGQIFAAQHGSWNRSKRTGYKVIMMPLNGGDATGEYVDFLTGFVTAEGNVWGRPVGVTTAADGALLVTDDASGTVWRVAYTGILNEIR